LRIARPILLVTTPVGLVFGLREAWRLAGPAMAVLMAMMLAVVGAFVWWTVRRIRHEAEAQSLGDESDDS
jgi:lysozyme family protein